MPALTDTFTLSNDVTIPKIGFGTWQIPDGPETYDSVRTALDAGYRHIDTARAYGNEASVGPRRPRQRHPPRGDLHHDQVPRRGEGCGRRPPRVRTLHGEAGPRDDRPVPHPRAVAVERHRQRPPRRQHRGVEGVRGALRGRPDALHRRQQLRRGRPGVADSRRRASCRTRTRSAGSSATPSPRRPRTARTAASSSKAIRRSRPAACWATATSPRSPRSTASRWRR